MPTARRRGAFVAVVGPDGAGKTSVAEALTRGWDGPTAYLHFRPPLRGPLVRHPSQAPDNPTPKLRDAGSRPGGWLRLLRSLVLFWMGYLRQIRPALRDNGLVVADRWGYGYVAQPAAVRFAGPRWLGHLAVRCLPQPDVTLNLVAPPAVIRARKDELSTAEITDELKRWAHVPARRLVHIDAARSADEVAAAALEVVQRELSR